MSPGLRSTTNDLVWLGLAPSTAYQVLIEDQIEQPGVRRKTFKMVKTGLPTSSLPHPSSNQRSLKTPWPLPSVASLRKESRGDADSTSFGMHESDDLKNIQ
ncbi:hypothetical protein CRG98_005799 [Punica granatum]|uniref:Uncharacterized protein n=1 Tax=Punica granatum TaxID=22663 RepID=A0A2I0KZB2_PUNGR|nr:hypothetical protein CRG98_005799 [Punica granatum]